MTLLTLRDASIAFGERPLLDRAELIVREGERVGLIGRNGTGKSTLLQLIAGRLHLDEGEIERRSGLTIALVEQEPQLPRAATLRESLLAGPAAGVSGPQLAAMLDRLGVDPEGSPEAASGGERRRAALAAALAGAPQLLLLDEPTNHLDIGGIERLEELIAQVPTAIIITHDREFLDRTVSRIVELDRGVLRSYPGNFAAYERRRESELEAELAAHRRFDKFWAQEEVWIRKGVEARRTRNEGRVRRLESLRQARAARRQRIGALALALDSGELSGRLVAELEAVSKRYGERILIANLSLRLMRGDRIGLIGPNGAGKSTLIRILLGLEPPDAGQVRSGTRLQVAYFDQMRAQLDPDLPLAAAIAPGSDWVEVNGRRKHVMSYLGDFLFPPHRAQAPVRMLSGGERNRLLLARLFARPANLLVLDEPTNDLDIESLELLEQTLQEYTGTLLLVSHDRRFLDQVVTQTLVAEGGGRWREYVGGYSDYLAQRSAARGAGTAARRSPPREPSSGTTQQPPAGARPGGRLSYRDQRELATLPGQIEALEREQAELIERMSAPEYHRREAAELRADHARAEAIAAQLTERYARWELLEAAAAAAQRP